MKLLSLSQFYAPKIQLILIFSSIRPDVKHKLKQGSYRILNINFQTFLNDIPRSNASTMIVNMTKVKLYQSWIKYYENACQKIKSGKCFSFSILTGQKQFFLDFSKLENDQNFFHTFPDSAGMLLNCTLTEMFFYLCNLVQIFCKFFSAQLHINETKLNV